MRVRVAGLGDECPGAGTKGAKGAEGEGHVVVVQILRLNDGPVVLVLLCAVLRYKLHLLLLLYYVKYRYYY